MDRRNLLGALTGATVVSLSGCLSRSTAGAAGAEMSLSVDDASLEVTSSDGVIDDVWIYVEVEFGYSRWEDHEITDIGFETRIDGETTRDAAYGVTHPDWIWDEAGDGDSGSGTYRVFQDRFGNDDRIFLFEDAPNYEQADLTVDEPGETETFELDFDIEMRLVADGDDVVWTGSDEATITIAHTHEADDGDGGDTDDGDTDDDTAAEDGEASMGIGTIDLGVAVDGEVVS